MANDVRVMLYVDGFNLYFGLRTKGWKRYYWLDVQRLGEKLLRPNQSLVGVKYFTADIRGPA
ncbi:MAG: NYN domain-containing protein, partial [Thermogutta sp.]